MNIIEESFEIRMCVEILVNDIKIDTINFAVQGDITYMFRVLNHSISLTPR